MPFMIPVTEFLTEAEAEEYQAGDGPGFYARLSAPGYLDCTDWMGPYPSQEQALVELCDFHECDTDGNTFGDDEYDDAALEEIRAALAK